VGKVGRRINPTAAEGGEAEVATLYWVGKKKDFPTDRGLVNPVAAAMARTRLDTLRV
jgi:hypothetical protein